MPRARQVWCCGAHTAQLSQFLVSSEAPGLQGPVEMFPKSTRPRWRCRAIARARSRGGISRCALIFDPPGRRRPHRPVKRSHLGQHDGCFHPDRRQASPPQLVRRVTARLGWQTRGYELAQPICVNDGGRCGGQGARGSRRDARAVSRRGSAVRQWPWEAERVAVPLAAAK